MAKRKRAAAAKSSRRKRSTAVDWRERLSRKRYEMAAWDWKDDPRPHIRALCRPFGVRPFLKELDRKYPEKLLAVIACEHGLHVYDAPSLDGSDVFGFILSRERLTRREIQQVEADYWGEDFDDVYEPAWRFV